MDKPKKREPLDLPEGVPQPPDGDFGSPYPDHPAFPPEPDDADRDR